MWDVTKKDITWTSMVKSGGFDEYSKIMRIVDSYFQSTK